MDITVNYEWAEDELRPLPIVELARFVIEHEEKPENTEVSISFVDDGEMARLNESYRGKDGPTDVLSFECDNIDDGFDMMPSGCDDMPYELGDIIIAPDVAKRQNDEFATTFQEEIELLLVHGLLHLCGYDHIEDVEAQVMEARESELLEEWRAR